MSIPIEEDSPHVRLVCESIVAVFLCLSTRDPEHASVDGLLENIR